MENLDLSVEGRDENIDLSGFNGEEVTYGVDLSAPCSMPTGRLTPTQAQVAMMNFRACLRAKQIINATPSAPPPTTTGVIRKPQAMISGGYTKCADEGNNCNFQNDASVAFGAGTTFAYKDASNGILCDISVLGDPLPGVKKECYYKSKPLPPPPAQIVPPSGYNKCADEGGACSLDPSNPTSVAYGSGNTFNYKTLTGNAPCNNDTFGDPTPGVVKSCFFQPQIAPPPPPPPVAPPLVLPSGTGYIAPIVAQPQLQQPLPPTTMPYQVTNPYDPNYGQPQQYGQPQPQQYGGGYGGGGGQPQPAPTPAPTPAPDYSGRGSDKLFGLPKQQAMIGIGILALGAVFLYFKIKNKNATT